MIPSNDFRISGSIFDYMTIYFFQRFYELPIINESKIGCSLVEFLQKDLDDQLEALEKTFEQYNKRMLTLGSDILFMNWVLFYASGVTYSEYIQITSPKEIFKTTEGIRTINILGLFAIFLKN